MAIKENGRIVYVKTESIEWVEAEGNYVRIHAGKNSYLQLGAIGGLEGFVKVLHEAIAILQFLQAERRGQ